MPKPRVCPKCNEFFPAGEQGCPYCLMWQNLKGEVDRGIREVKAFGNRLEIKTESGVWIEALVSKVIWGGNLKGKNLEHLGWGGDDNG